MGNNNDCCSDCNERNNKMVTRLDRQDMTPNEMSQSPISSKKTDEGLKNSMLDSLRNTYKSNYLKDVEETLNLRKTKGKSEGSVLSKYEKCDNIMIDSFLNDNGSWISMREEKILINRIKVSSSLLKDLKFEGIKICVCIFFIFYIKNIYCLDNVT